MKIGIDCRMMGVRHGGIGRYVLELVKYILKLDSKNEYVLFYNSDLEEAILQITENISHVNKVLVNIRHYSLMEQIKFNSILNKYNLDLVHFPNFNIPIMYKKKFVVTIHDVVHHKISGAKKTRLPHFWAYKKVIAHAAKYSQIIITVSKAAKKEIVKYLGVDEQKIKVIYSGANIADNIQENYLKEVKERFLINKPYFLFVGVLERKKNVVALARAFDEFIEKYKLDMDLVIVGREDKHYPDIRFHALQIKNSNHLIFTGEVSEQQLKALYKGAYSFVSASTHEGFGLPGVEAMKFGLPLIVSNTDVFNEIYDNAAVYFDSENQADIAEKLFLIARDPDFHKQMQQKSFNRGEFFNWQSAAKETVEIYNQVLVSSK